MTMTPDNTAHLVAPWRAHSEHMRKTFAKMEYILTFDHGTLAKTPQGWIEKSPGKIPGETGDALTELASWGEI